MVYSLRALTEQGESAELVEFLKCPIHVLSAYVLVTSWYITSKRLVCHSYGRGDQGKFLKVVVISTFHSFSSPFLLLRSSPWYDNGKSETRRKQTKKLFEKNRYRSEGRIAVNHQKSNHPPNYIPPRCASCQKMSKKWRNTSRSDPLAGLPPATSYPFPSFLKSSRRVLFYLVTTTQPSASSLLEKPLSLLANSPTENTSAVK